MDLRERLVPIEHRRQALLDRVSALDPARLTAAPADGGWSILEIIEHLVLVEEVVLGAPNAPPFAVPQQRSLGNRIRYLLVMVILRVGIDVRAPSRRMLPTGEADLATLRRRWDTNQAWFRDHLDGLDPVAARRPVFRHPISGPIDAHQALSMLDAHLARHESQLRRRMGET